MGYSVYARSIGQEGKREGWAPKLQLPPQPEVDVGALLTLIAKRTEPS